MDMARSLGLAAGVDASAGGGGILVDAGEMSRRIWQEEGEGIRAGR